jgi:imidazolonepropionase-like amidohydrolase
MRHAFFEHIVSTEESTVVISASTIVDGTGEEPLHNASIVIKGDRIVRVGKTSELASEYSKAKKIEAPGKTIMPGMVECHFHMFIDTEYASGAQSDIDINRPAQWFVLSALRACEIALKCGYTSVVGAGSGYNVDFWVNQAIQKGIFRGPRIIPASREITSTGGYVDWSPSWWPKTDGLGITVDGPHEALEAARKVMKDGAEIVKIYPSGEGGFIGKYHPYFHDCRREREVMTFEEVEAVVKEVHRWNRLTMAHCRNRISVKTCLKSGVDIINHATDLDQECYSLFKQKPPLAVCPALGFIWFIKGQDWGDPEYFKAAGYEEEYERGCENMKRLYKMGVRIVPGGDYGQSDVPHGLYAKDLEVFVKDCGFSPLETLTMATRDGSHLMRMSDQVGTLEVGKKADLLIIDGDPIEDITILQDKRRILAVVKDGQVQASKGKVVPYDWDMFDQANFPLLTKAVSRNSGIPTKVPIK